MIGAVILDLDNTLVDFVALKEQATQAAVTAMVDAGLQMKKQQAQEKIWKIYREEGWEYQQVFDRFLEQELGQIDYRILAAGVVGYRKAKEAALVLYPHVTMTLMELAKRGLKLVVVSDAPRLQVWLRLVDLGLHHFFDHVITFDDTGERKPSQAPFRKALELLDMAPEEVLMVGDWPERDVVGAKEVGMKTVFARYGDTFDTTDSGADYELDSFRDLLTVLDKEGTPVTVASP